MKHLYSDTITIYPNPVRDEYGKEVWGTGTDIIGRFTLSDKLAEDVNGKEIIVDAIAHIEDTTGLAIGEKVVNEGVAYRIVSFKKAKNGLGTVKFIKLLLKRIA